MTPEARAAALVKNGITVEDLKASKNEGYQQGVESAIATAYAAFCMTLRDLYGYDQERVIEALRAVDDRVINSLTSWEIIDEVFDTIGIRIAFREPFDRIQEAT